MPDMQLELFDVQQRHPKKAPVTPIRVSPLPGSQITFKMDVKKVTAAVRIKLSILRYEKKLEGLRPALMRIYRTFNNTEYNEYLKRTA